MSTAIADGAIQTGTEVAVGVSGDSLEDVLVAVRASGRRIRRISAYRAGGTDRYALITNDASPGDRSRFECEYRLDEQELMATHDRYLGAGYRMIDLSVTVIDDTPRFAGVWVRDGLVTIGSLQIGLVPARYRAETDRHIRSGCRLARLVGYSIRGIEFYGALWEQAGACSFVVKHKLSEATLHATDRTLRVHGYELTDLSAYVVAGRVWYAAIWEVRDELVKSKWMLSATELNESIDDMATLGFEPEHICGTEVGGQDFYHVIWSR